MPIHCFAIDGFELRQVQVKATKPYAAEMNPQHTVIYRGPFDEVIDEQGVVFPRGVRKSIDNACWKKLSSVRIVSISFSFQFENDFHNRMIKPVLAYYLG